VLPVTCDKCRFPKPWIRKRPENLKQKRRVKTDSSSKISVLFLISGILSFVFSVYSASQMLALIGLGLTFWGALFLLLKPRKFIESSLLYSATVSEYLTIDRIINEFNYKGRGYYIPPYPKDVYLPEYLKGLKASVVFISGKNNSEMPSIEEIAKGNFMSKSQKGVLVVPPGSGILTQIEETMNMDFTKMSLNELCEVLPTILLQDFNLAKEIEMKPDGDNIHLKMLDSLYKNLYSARNALKSVSLIGCPITGAVACALAKNSGRNVTIQKQQVSPDGSAVQVWYRMGQG
jgi:hypothetical protein